MHFVWFGAMIKAHFTGPTSGDVRIQMSFLTGSWPRRADAERKIHFQRLRVLAWKALVNFQLPAPSVCRSRLVLQIFEELLAMLIDAERPCPKPKDFKFHCNGLRRNNWKPDIWFMTFKMHRLRPGLRGLYTVCCQWRSLPAGCGKGFCSLCPNFKSPLGERRDVFLVATRCK